MKPLAIVIVDEDRSLADNVGERLELVGCRTIAAYSGSVPIDAIRPSSAFPVADNDPEISENSASLLADNGSGVLPALDSSTALKKAAVSKLDVPVIDLRLQEMNRLDGYPERKRRDRLEPFERDVLPASIAQAGRKRESEP